MLKLFHKIDQGLDRFCRFALTISVASMLGLTLMNIVLRWTGQSLLWVEPLVRHLVFCCAFLGGSIATGKNSHISIDIMSKILEANNSQKALKIQQAVISLVSALVVAGLAYASFSFMEQEFEFGKEEFLGIHSGFLVAVLPLGFSLIGYRFFFQFMKAFSPEEQKES